MKGSKIILLVIILFSSCNPRVLQPDDYIKWYANHINEFTKTSVVQGVEYQISVKPDDYLIANALKRNLTSLDDVRAIVKEGDKSLSVVLTLSVNQQHPIYGIAKDQKGYDEYLSYYMYDFQYDIQIKTKQGLKPITNYEFLRNFGHKPKLDVKFEIPYTKQLAKGNPTLRIDNKMLNTGLVNINLNDIYFAIKESPELEIKI